MIEGILLPEADDDSAPFWGACAAGELRIQECSSCSRLRFPPRPLCPWCRSFEHEWAPVSGRGTVWSFVRTHPPLLPAYAEVAPYNVIIVALDDDPTIRLVGNLVETDEGTLEALSVVDADTIEIGEPVEVVFAEIDAGEGETVTLPRWRRPIEES